jgi:hypothetical protein
MDGGGGEMGDVSYWTLCSIILGGIGTIAIFSFLIKENSLYRAFEHIFIGVAAGIGPVLVLRDFLWPQIVDPMLGNAITAYPDGTFSGQYQPLYLLYLCPMALGLLYYTIYSRKYAWLSKIAIGISLGASGALAIRGFFAEVIPQIASSFKPVLVWKDDAFRGIESLNNSLFVIILLLVLNYFFFTLGRKDSLQSRTAGWGRPLLMVCFGAFFGSTVMARLALLVERVQFISRDWVTAIATLLGGIF